MGVHLPLFVVHDVGALLSVPRGAGGFVVRGRDGQLARTAVPPAARGHLEAYRRLLENIAASEVAEKLAGFRLRDEMIAVLLSRILSDLYNRWRDRGKSASVEAISVSTDSFTSPRTAGTPGPSGRSQAGSAAPSASSASSCTP